MMTNFDLLNSVRNSLASETGRLRYLSEITGISYDTILRIKNGEGDPGYSKVQALFDYYAEKVGASETAQKNHEANVRAAASQPKRLKFSKTTKLKEAA